MPVGYIENPVTFRAAAALAAAGAWDAAPLEIQVGETDWVSFYCTYTRGAVGGAVDVRVQASPYVEDQAGVEDWFDLPLCEAQDLTAGDEFGQSLVARGIATYTPNDAAAHNFVLPCDPPLKILETHQRLRVVARESGDTDNPGTLHVVGIVTVREGATGSA